MSDTTTDQYADAEGGRSSPDATPSTSHKPRPYHRPTPIQGTIRPPPGFEPETNTAPPQAPAMPDFDAEEEDLEDADMENDTEMQDREV